MRIYTRAEWGARYAAGSGPVRLPVRELWLHHTVTQAPADSIEAEKRAMRSVEQIGQNRFGRGISYTFAVMPSGRIYEGTGAGRLGTHTGGRNSISHAIVLVGNYDTTVPSNMMLTGVADLVRHGHRSGWWQQNRLTGGHRDVKATGCPGRHAYERIQRMNAMAGAGPTPAPAPITPGSRTIRQGDKGADVVAWQRHLRIRDDGDFGPETHAWTVDYQRRHGLTPDGIVGPQTWATYHAAQQPIAPPPPTPPIEEDEDMATIIYVPELRSHYIDRGTGITYLHRSEDIESWKAAGAKTVTLSKPSFERMVENTPRQDQLNASLQRIEAALTELAARREPQ
jgi:hypothetical protein